MPLGSDWTGGIGSISSVRWQTTQPTPNFPAAKNFRAASTGNSMVVVMYHHSSASSLNFSCWKPSILLTLNFCLSNMRPSFWDLGRFRSPLRIFSSCNQLFRLSSINSMMDEFFRLRAPFSTTFSIYGLFCSLSLDS